MWKKHEEPWRTRWSFHSNSFHHDPSPSSPWSFWSCSKSLWTANCQWTVASNTRSPPSRTDLPSEQWSNHAGDHRENNIKCGFLLNIICHHLSSKKWGEATYIILYIIYIHILPYIQLYIPSIITIWPHSEEITSMTTRTTTVERPDSRE